MYLPFFPKIFIQLRLHTFFVSFLSIIVILFKYMYAIWLYAFRFYAINKYLLSASTHVLIELWLPPCFTARLLFTHSVCVRHEAICCQVVRASSSHNQLHIPCGRSAAPSSYPCLSLYVCFPWPHVLMFRTASTLLLFAVWQARTAASAAHIAEPQIESLRKPAINSRCYPSLPLPPLHEQCAKFTTLPKFSAELQL